MDTVTEKRKRQAKTIGKWLFWFVTAGAVLLSFLLFSLIVYAKVLGAPPLQVPQTSVFYSSDGKVFAKVEHQNQNRYWVELDDISPHLIHATIAIEDKRFYEHNGFDWKRMAGAAWKDFKTMSLAEGASTITMQYARNLFLSHEKSWSRKLKEAFYTLRLEMNYSKDQILEGYLNTIYYGNGAYGIQAASQYYFNKNAAELSLSEAALLAGIPKGPSYYAPDENYQNAKQRQQIILQAMTEDEYITKKQAEAAAQKPINLHEPKRKVHRTAPYFQDAAEDRLRELGISEKVLATGGLKIYTTLNTELQKKAEYWVNKIINPKSKIQAALIAMDPKTGAVEALIGGRNYQKVKFNHAIQARRAPGSTFKPFLYYTALEHNYTPSTTLISRPTAFKVNGGQDYWVLNNYNNQYANGPITMMQALALSDNIYAAKTNIALGPEKLAATAKKMGITAPLAPVPSLALGTEEVSVYGMARAYSTIANYGKRINPYFIEKVVDHDGDVIYERKPESKQVLDPAASFVLAQMMTGIFDPRLNDYNRVTGSSVRDTLTHKVAAKTGSTASDSWMAGFTPNLTTAVWVGYSDGRKLNKYPEPVYAKEIFASFMEDALENQPKNPFTKIPEGVVGKLVDPGTGKLASANCPNARMTYYVEGTAPQSYCDVHKGKRLKQPETDQNDSSKESQGEKTKDKGWMDKIRGWFPW